MLGFELAVFDLDGTVANTFVSSSYGPSVEEACALAFEQMFGRVGRELFKSVDGLQNRSTAEITRVVIERGGAQQLLRNLQDRLAEFNSTLGMYVPNGKGVTLCNWDENDPYRTATEIFARMKLAQFKIGVNPDKSMWPESCAGVLPYIDALRERGVNVGILSMGHEYFIQQCFWLWGRKCPEHLLTDDDLRGLSIPAEERIKPHPKLFDLFLEQFFQRTGRRISRNSIIYYGDDLKKDGLLAYASGIPFGWYNPSGKEGGSGLPIPQCNFHSWGELPVP